MKKKNNTLLITMLKCLLFGVVIYILIKDLDVEYLFGLLDNLIIRYIVWAVIALTFIFVLSAFKWGFIIPQIKFIERLRGVMLSHTISYTIGGQLAGETGRIILTKGHDVSKTLVAASVIIDKMIGLAGVLAVGLFGMICSFDSFPMFMALFMVFFYVVCILIVIALLSQNSQRLILKLAYKGEYSESFADRSKKKLYGFMCDISSCTLNRKNTIYNLICSILMQVLSIYVMFFVFLSMGIRIDICFLCAIAGVSSIAGIIPVSLIGVGIPQITEKGLLEIYGVSAECISAQIAIKYALLVSFALLGGVCILKRGKNEEAGL